MDMLQKTIAKWNKNLAEVRGDFYAEFQAQRVIQVLYSISEGMDLSEALIEEGEHFRWQMEVIFDEAGLYGPPAPDAWLCLMAAEVEEQIANEQYEEWLDRRAEATGLPRFSDEDEGLVEPEEDLRDRWEDLDRDEIQVICPRHEEEDEDEDDFPF